MTLDLNFSGQEEEELMKPHGQPPGGGGFSRGYFFFQCLHLCMVGESRVRDDPGGRWLTAELKRVSFPQCPVWPRREGGGQGSSQTKWCSEGGCTLGFSSLKLCGPTCHLPPTEAAVMGVLGKRGRCNIEAETERDTALSEAQWVEVWGSDCHRASIPHYSHAGATFASDAYDAGTFWVQEVPSSGCGAFIRGQHLLLFGRWSEIFKMPSDTMYYSEIGKKSDCFNIIMENKFGRGLVN